MDALSHKAEYDTDSSQKPSEPSPVLRPCNVIVTVFWPDLLSFFHAATQEEIPPEEKTTSSHNHCIGSRMGSYLPGVRSKFSQVC